MALLLVLAPTTWSRAGSADVATASEASPVAGESERLVTVEGETLTVRATQTSRKELLEDIAQRARVSVEMLGLVDERVTVSFAAVPLDEGLRRILHTHDFIMIYGGSGRLVSVLVLSASAARPDRGTGASAGPGGGRSREPALDNLREALRSEVASIRERAVNELGAIGTDAVVPMLAEALRDQEPRVRVSALGALSASSRDTVPLIAAALGDPEASVREEAVRALALKGGPRVVPLLNEALRDPSNAVRAEALKVLEELTGGVGWKGKVK